MTRTEAIRRAIETTLEQHRPQLDAANDLEGVAIVLRFRPEHLRPRAVTVRTDPPRTWPRSTDPPNR